MKNSKLYVSILSILGLVLIYFLFSKGNYFYEFLKQSSITQKQIDAIFHKELVVDEIVLKHSVYMYSNFDEIDKAIRMLQNRVYMLDKNDFFKTNYPQAYNFFKKYKVELNKKIDDIYRFETINSSLKNSFMFLLTYINQLSLNKDVSIYYYIKVVKIVSDIMLLKSTHDIDFFKNLDIKYFTSLKFIDKNLEKDNKFFIAHLINIKNNFNLYYNLLEQILNSKTKKLLSKIDKEVFETNTYKSVEIKSLSLLIIIFIAFYTIISIFLLIWLERENKKLKLLTKELKYLSLRDVLTGVYNRYKFEIDIKKLDEKEIVFFIVNINGFRYINEYYGSEFGDKVLVYVANKLQELLKNHNAIIYRIGGDDFGVILKREKLKLKKVIENIIDFFENNECEIDGVILKVTVKIGISLKRPFFENALIALKKVKNIPRKKYLFFKDEFNLRKEIEENIKKSKELYSAIKEDRLIPVFQPIVDLKTQKVVKYEVLARLKLDDRLVSIFPYLEIAKENKLYEEITSIILKKAIEEFKDVDMEFSINFSIEDILDRKIWKILAKANRDYGIINKMTFEILESEAISDYSDINKFVKYIKSMGGKVAIDDFGSGYSNFSHIAKMNADFVKIDGSLIKNLDKDENLFNILKGIVYILRSLNIEIVAEFVENEKIVQKLKELDIIYGQGYYLGKPSENINL